MRLIGATAALALSIAIDGGAQTPLPDRPATLAGRVLDATDSAAIAGADVWIRGTKLVARSDGYGRFRIDRIPSGVTAVAVRAFGYDSLSRSVTLAAGAAATTEIYMVRRPHMLTQMVVHGRSMRVPRRFEDVYRRGHAAGVRSSPVSRSTPSTPWT